uniref:hypothetical protein n=1 Tax=Actinoplanes sp. CA-151224 TaxID=3239904 RepID=UPI003F49AB00
MGQQAVPAAAWTVAPPLRGDQQEGTYGAVKSRRWDRQPETAADKKFFDLRESGYKGPIDQDGNKVTTGEAADILRRMAQRRGENPDW